MNTQMQLKYEQHSYDLPTLRAKTPQVVYRLLHH